MFFPYRETLDLFDLIFHLFIHFLLLSLVIFFSQNNTWQWKDILFFIQIQTSAIYFVYPAQYFDIFFLHAFFVF